MKWLIWRQHRADAAVLLTVLALTALALVPNALDMHHLFETSGAAECLAAERGGCRSAFLQDIADGYQPYINSVVPWLVVLPAACGMFLGAPLLAREYEHGTWQLAWSQSVPRTRWLTGKLLAVGVAVVLTTAATSWLVTWWFSADAKVKGRLDMAFSVQGLVYPAHALFAFAAGALAGCLLRRTLPAMAATLTVYLAVRVPVETQLRMRLLPPRELVLDPTRKNVHLLQPGPADRVLGQGLTGPDGQHLSKATADTLAAEVPRGAWPRYLHDHGLRDWYVYQPADRFWTLQAIEAGLFLALTAILLATLLVRIRRRPV
ncbi:ABC transporter permease subunit [Streptomyces sp. NPDC048172]|uniref:ABC transporter permease subunit n=1 Tax=Streptomyces sp. NPDC048172 TaxID=3365505 RepID=UPI003716631F